MLNLFLTKYIFILFNKQTFFIASVSMKEHAHACSYIQYRVFYIKYQSSTISSRVIPAHKYSNYTYLHVIQITYHASAKKLMFCLSFGIDEIVKTTLGAYLSAFNS